MFRTWSVRSQGVGEMKDGHIPCLLIVDENRDIADLIEEYVACFGEYTVVKAFSGTDALVKVEEILPELVLLDMMMDDMHGTEVCRAIKSNENTSHIPVIAVTVIHEVHKAEYREIMESGVDGFVEKPIVFEKLKGVIEKYLRTP